MWHRTLDCLGVAVAITSRVDEIAPHLESVFRTYPDSAAVPDVTYELEMRDCPTLLRDGQVVERQRKEIELVAVLEIDLYREVMARAAGLMLHAGAVVGRGGRALVFAGISGAGKSTLVRALLERGFAYLSEECVALHEDGTCAGLARPLYVEHGVAVPPGFSADPYLVTRRREVVVSGQVLRPPESAIWRGPARAAALVILSHAPDAEGRLEPLSGGAVLADLWPMVFRQDDRAVADAAGALTSVARYRMHTRSPEQAVDRALALARDLDALPS